MSLLPRAEDRASAAETVRHTEGTDAPAPLPDVCERETAHAPGAVPAPLSGPVTGAGGSIA
ncbi:hypothetical protein ACPCBC_20270 [Streptomyces incarnatus]|nr:MULTISPECIES: hypothetical protein [Streptomyces]